MPSIPLLPAHGRQTKISQHAQDLSSQVVRTDRYCFACGGHADIYMGEYSGRAVAVKVVRGILDLETFSRRLLLEVMIWSMAKHPNILPLLGISYDFDKPGVPCLIAPFHRNGTITKYLELRPDISRLPMLAQISSGLSYLHSIGIIHNDVKASNVLINDKGEACVSDYGLSRFLEKSGLTTKTQSATWRHSPPQRFHEDEAISRPTKATDVWSFAMTVVEIFTGCMPFSHINNDASVILSILSGDRPKRELCQQIDNDVWLVLVKSWNTEPALRPSMATLSQFFASQVNSRSSIEGSSHSC